MWFWNMNCLKVSLDLLPILLGCPIFITIRPSIVYACNIFLCNRASQSCRCSISCHVPSHCFLWKSSVTTSFLITCKKWKSNRFNAAMEQKVEDFYLLLYCDEFVRSANRQSSTFVETLCCHIHLNNNVQKPIWHTQLRPLKIDFMFYIQN